MKKINYKSVTGYKRNLKNKGITLIALVITIIIILLLSGIAIVQLTGNGLFEKAKISKKMTRYVSAKEIVDLKLMDIQIDCTEKEEEYNIKKIAKEMELAENIKIEKYYNKQNEEITNETTELDGIVVSVNEYSEYKFLIEEQGKITGILEGEITNETTKDEFIDTEKFKENITQKEEENNSEELQKYKKEIAKTLTELGVKTEYTQTVNEYINNIRALANKNYEEGKQSNIVLLKKDLSSREAHTISLTEIEGYQDFDTEDFIIVNKTIEYVTAVDGEEILQITKSYDKQTGTLVLGKQKSSAHRYTFFNTYDLYAIKINKQEIEISNNSNSNTKENLNDFKNKLAEILEECGIENSEENLIINKTEKEICEDIKKIVNNKLKEGISTYITLIQSDLSSRYEQTVSITNIEGYENLTIENFLIINKNMCWSSGYDTEEPIMTKSYNPSIGELTLGKQYNYTQYAGTIWNNYDIILIKKNVIDLDN